MNLFLKQNLIKKYFISFNSVLQSNLIGEVISDALISGNIRTRKKEELRKAEFLRIGQVKQKQKTIITYYIISN